ncbi:MAG: exosome complex protein Rrp4 [Candidatus Diapherotrites archaeon]
MGKRIVVPGELITEQRKRLGQHVYIRDGKIYSDVLGIASEQEDVASVVPLKGKYIPENDDLIVGVVSSEKFSGYVVDINSIYPSFVKRDEFREELKRGSIISAKVAFVNELNEAELTGARVFYSGEVVQAAPVKVPRIIGRNGSMLEVLKKGTGCSLLVGRNGWIWVKGGNQALLAKALDKIDKEAHLENLTNSVAEFLGAGEKAAAQNNANQSKMNEEPGWSAGIEENAGPTE